MNNEIYFHDYLNAKPKEIPLRLSFSPSCREIMGVDLITKIITENKDMFPNYGAAINEIKTGQFLPWQTAGADYYDSWGVLWRTSVNGITGAAVKPSIESWDDFAGFKPPDPELQNGWGKIDWAAIKEKFDKSKKAKMGGLRHGFLFLTLTYIRGYQNLIFDMYDDEPRLAALIDMVYRFNDFSAKRFLSYGTDIVSFPEDLGAQNGPLVTPAAFKKYLKPVYQKLFRPVKEQKKTIYMHSDGLILDLVDDLLEAGVDILNMQDLVNGLDNIKNQIKGRAGIDLDIDRQKITVFGSEKDIDDHIKEAVIKLGDNEKGFGMFYQIYPETPVNNIYAVINAFRKYRNYYQ
ncbi:MAG: hypothetical protein FWD78_06560 [Treponema sp.]|nr:hypothetical protein [Treponema sp.]